MPFKGKVAIVTGGARGIGRAYSTALLNEGGKVCVCDINEDIAEEFLSGLPEDVKGNAIFQKCDVTVYNDLKDAFDIAVRNFGRLDLVVNNAAILDESKMVKTIEVNFIAVAKSIHLAYQYMGLDKGGKGGSIVNTSSIAGHTANPLCPIYTATKHAVIGLTKSYGSDYHLKKSGIKMYAICPGQVNTPLCQDFIYRCIDAEEGKKYVGKLPWTSVEDLGKGLIKLLEDGKNGSKHIIHFIMSMKGKVALVTGGARGIGRAYTTALLNNGVKVCICDVNEITASEFIGSLPDNLKKNAFFQKCDVTDVKNFKDAFDKTIEVFGKIDIVVNNAGIQDEHNWKKTIEVNLMAVIQGVKLAFQYMGVDNGGKGGSVVNTASVAGLMEMPISPVYCATKHAVVGLTKSYGAEYHLKKSGIKVNAICPGAVNTHLYKAFAPSSLDEEEGKKFVETFPLVPSEDLGRGLIQILEDGKNGSLLVVDEKGPHYV
ncbi:uncharacterized protein [Parasteatoda tepidariorum]|uniref:uncharacterized protein n=1 Tax=Parasteatoda tepidariorum TaxID=114398 RepID=UPI0039BC3440